MPPTFATTVLSGKTYGVTALTQPTSPWQTCPVALPAGTVGGPDITLTVSCSTQTHPA